MFASGRLWAACLSVHRCDDDHSVFVGTGGDPFAESYCGTCGHCHIGDSCTHRYCHCGIGDPYAHKRCHRRIGHPCTRKWRSARLTRRGRIPQRLVRPHGVPDTPRRDARQAVPRPAARTDHGVRQRVKPVVTYHLPRHTRQGERPWQRGRASRPRVRSGLPRQRVLLRLLLRRLAQTFRHRPVPGLAGSGPCRPVHRSGHHGDRSAVLEPQRRAYRLRAGRVPLRWAW